jgi:hypothetical protein
VTRITRYGTVHYAVETEAGNSQKRRLVRCEPHELAESIAAGYRSLGRLPLVWLTGDLIVRVRERLRRVQGR